MLMQGMFQSRLFYVLMLLNVLIFNSYKILHKYKTMKYVKNNYFSKKCNFKVL